ncbi:MAG: hypothetical protein GQ549_04365 [Gammaproteobacteria bacterium]|nr:hypothetical protein [Gammaproteobacteria bacterium]
MNSVKNLSRIVMLLLFVSMTNVYAERPDFRVDEVAVENVKIANDRTGIIKDVYCYDCDFSMVKITKKTTATRNSVAVDILEVKKLSDIAVAIRFDPKTREVLSINW